VSVPKYKTCRKSILIIAIYGLLTIICFSILLDRVAVAESSESPVIPSRITPELLDAQFSTRELRIRTPDLSPPLPPIAGDGSVLDPNLDSPISEVFISADAFDWLGLSEYISRMVGLIHEANPGIRIHVLGPRGPFDHTCFPGLDLVLEMARVEDKPYVSPMYISNMEGITLWAQDNFEVVTIRSCASTDSGSLNCLVLGHAYRRNFGGIVAGHRGITAVNFTPANGCFEGGNIEFGPENLVVIGNNVLPETTERLRKLGQYVGVIPTHILRVGHVDEMLQFLKLPDRRWAIAVADPLQGLNLMESIIGSEEFSRFSRLGSAFGLLYGARILELNQYRPEAEYYWESGVLRTVNTRIAQEINDALQMILEFYRARGLYLEVIRLPALFSPRGLALEPNPVNFLKINNTVIYPASQFDHLTTAVSEIFESFNLNPQPVVTTGKCGPHTLYGGIHCATQVLRQDSCYSLNSSSSSTTSDQESSPSAGGSVSDGASSGSSSSQDFE
jgi:hypothetical protein